VAPRLSPSWNDQARKTFLSSDGISYEVSEKIHAISYGELGPLQQVVKWSGQGLGPTTSEFLPTGGD